MATIKSYTDIEQSKKLAEFLPLESADMCWSKYDDGQIRVMPMELWDLIKDGLSCLEFTPAWSLAALLSVLPKEIEIDGQRYTPCLFPVGNDWLLKLWYNSNHIFTSPIAIFSDNPIDACYELILKLHELKML